MTVAEEVLIFLSARKGSSPYLPPLPRSFLLLLQFMLCSPLYIGLEDCNLYCAF